MLEGRVAGRERIESIVENELPPLPFTVAKVLEVARDPFVSPIILNKVITSDPVLTSKVLSVVNSAYYGVTNKVKSVVQAIIMLGINTIRDIALSTALLPLAQQLAKKVHQYGFDITGFWEHSLATGVTSRLIALHLKIDPKEAEVFFISGLLHDIGKLIIGFAFPEDYPKAMERSLLLGTPLYKIETEMFGIDHAEIADIIKKRWSVPREIELVIKHHHNMEVLNDETLSQSERRLLAASIVANTFCNELGFGNSGDNSPQSIDPLLMQILGFDTEVMYTWEEKIKVSLEKARIFLKLVRAEGEG